MTQPDMLERGCVAVVAVGRLDLVAESFAAAIDDDAIRAVVLLVHGSGWTRTGVPALAEEIALRRKPTWSVVAGPCGGAPLWIAAASERVIALPGAVFSVRHDPIAVGLDHELMRAVARARHRRPETITRLFEGRVWINAGMALEGGLIDEVDGSFRRAVCELTKESRGNGLR
jgi:ClpP class serine protease